MYALRSASVSASAWISGDCSCGIVSVRTNEGRHAWSELSLGRAADPRRARGRLGLASELHADRGPGDLHDPVGDAGEPVRLEPLPQRLGLFRSTLVSHVVPPSRKPGGANERPTRATPQRVD